MVGWTPVYTRTWGGTPGLTGLIDAIGTNDGVDAYVNPHDSEKVIASQSSNADSTRHAFKAFDHSNTPSNETATGNVANSWWQVDFKVHGVVLTRVGLWNCSALGHHPRTFKIQGSVDGISWTDLLTVSNPSSADGTWWTGEITSTTPWSYVRVLQTGTNTSGQKYLVLGEVEFWGELFEYIGTPPTMVGQAAARIARKPVPNPNVLLASTAVRVLRKNMVPPEPVSLGAIAIRVLRKNMVPPEPVSLGAIAIRVLRRRQKSPFSIFTGTGRTPIAVRNPST